MEKEKKRRGRKPRKANDEVVSITTNPLIVKDTSFSCDNKLDNLIVQLDKVKSEDINELINKEDAVLKGSEFVYSPEVNTIKPYNDDISNITQSIVDFHINNDLKPEEKVMNISDKVVNFSLTSLRSSLFKSDNWPLKTDINCWWCCHEFDSIPLGMPVGLDKDSSFKVIGCFCSFNCMLSYALDTNNKNRGLIYSLYRSLLKKPVFDNQLKTIVFKRAPPRSSLKKFGGSLSIEEFRNNFKNYKEYNVLTVPMISISQKLEEKEEIKMVEKDTKKIKRVKPLQKKEYTLEHLMGITN
jgi:hypothetical protein